MFHRTQRLLLRPTWPEDWQMLFAGIADQDVVHNLATAPWPYEEDDARAFAQREQDAYVPGFAVTLPGEGLIGGAGLGYDEHDQVQLGYWIARDHWGKGYASEAARGVLAIAGMIGHKRVVASHFVDNPASGRVLCKVGFSPTGEVRPGHSLARGRSDPVACYEIVLDGLEREGDERLRASPPLKNAA
ncbi:GNAT family N-acetyltransferase [Parerythrobacter jejuensis]|uniref:GNAT family N-acetyltransferase n=1 Tax=Parerythrobacter jejuensis TaxID=795812 RepID=A0A845ANI8_9SPHN|nr:GNAT family N-acetyltransferase [Parerythrobacter jejuensis]MXP31850.1 GNAT family N-acetyltransferase [Parerythrobacter jejuensis]